MASKKGKQTITAGGQTGDAPADAKIEIRLHRPTLYTLPNKITLYPGPDQNNRITLDDWNACKDHPVVRAWLREGAITVDGSEVEIPTLPSPQQFRTRRSEEAVALIQACDDAAQIRAWAEADPRKTVRRAAQTRLVDLQAAGTAQAQIAERVAASQAVDAPEAKDDDFPIVTQAEIDQLGDGPVPE